MKILRLTNNSRTKKCTVSQRYRDAQQGMSLNIKLIIPVDGQIQFYCYTSSPDELVHRHNVNYLFQRENISDE